ncbi:PREDICTED: uncharacterized protein LOC104801571 [Tarenaya hassleriana]|uniref:uncharacterized protein LOC104801571 n=1 Tax=Tarenaya hassleriana TaxID=28532 RepID=UPI00053C1CB4|nr:PREDICTED: uncharacterized protein LOC104801571 [Tarenaya hassleriana]
MEIFQSFFIKKYFRTLFHSLSGKTACYVLHSRLYLCWIVLYIHWAVLFVVQAPLIGIMGTLTENFDARLFIAAQERWVLIRVLFFLGLHEVMMVWFRLVVKPVVDDTIPGVYTEKRLSERGVVAVTFGMMWWWRPMEEAEGLAVVAEPKHKLLIGLEALDYGNWLIYYTCAVPVIGILRVLRRLL